MSVGAPDGAYSLSGQWLPESQWLLIALMFLGRMRWVVTAIEYPVMAPAGADQELSDDIEMASIAEGSTVYAPSIEQILLDEGNNDEEAVIARTSVEEREAPSRIAEAA